MVSVQRVVAFVNHDCAPVVEHHFAVLIHAARAHRDNPSVWPQ